MGDTKLRKEEFVTNLSGSDLGTVTQVIVSSMILHGLWKISQKYLLRVGIFKASSNGFSVIEFSWEFICLMLPFLFILTGCADYLTEINVTGSLVLSAGYYFSPKKANKKNRPKLTSATGLATPWLPFVSVARSVLMILTVVAILAVDFTVFPRYFAKTENFGSSLMDLGVGAFVFSAGGIAGRLINSPSYIAGSRLTNLKNSLLASIPLWSLGFFRLYLLKSLDYQEHASEYGVYWNFYFTLGTLPLVIALLECTCLPIWILSWLPAAVYQIFLNTTSLQHYILWSERIPGDVLSLNREGIFSLLGYASIFLIGKETGQASFNPAPPPILKKVTYRFIVTLIIFFIIYYGLDLPISRRLANLSYVAWISWVSLFHMLGFCYLYEVLEIQNAPILYQAINYNGMIVFLFANLLVLLINVYINTLDVTTNMAYMILVGYIFAIAVFAQTLFAYKIKIL